MSSTKTNIAMVAIVAALVATLCGLLTSIILDAYRNRRDFIDKEVTVNGIRGVVVDTSHLSLTVILQGPKPIRVHVDPKDVVLVTGPEKP
jgi:hypothetical protein